MKTTSLPIRRRVRRAGLTLIELVMVLIILSALAAMIVPIIDNIRRTSDKATASGVMMQIVENVSLYRTQIGSYPDRFDSLLLGDDAAPGTAPAGEYTAVKGSGTWFKMMQDLSANEKASLTKIGITTVMDHDPDSALVYRSLPGNSGVVPRDLDTDASVAVIVKPDIIRSVYPEIDTASTQFDPNTGIITLDDGVTARLVALGVGPNNTAVGKTMVSPPAYPGVDGLKNYNRFIGIFAVYDGAINTKKRAQLKGALDSAGDFLNQELNEVTENNLE